jgi:hypothetical protein
MNWNLNEKDEILPLDCRYSKGIWSECNNGLKSRLDSLKSDPSSTFGCEATRNVTKTCKEGVLYYYFN